jgi:hypothetical protein
MTAKLLIAGVAALAAITFAPVAQANNDQMFNSFLDAHDISARIPDVNNAVQSGHMACRESAAGRDEISVELDVSGRTHPGISRSDAS